MKRLKLSFIIIITITIIIIIIIIIIMNSPVSFLTAKWRNVFLKQNYTYIHNLYLSV